MTKAKLQQAADIALKVIAKKATEGEKLALQMFMAVLSRREERAFEKVLTAAINEVTRQRLVAESKAIHEARKAYWASSP